MPALIDRIRAHHGKEAENVGVHQSVAEGVRATKQNDGTILVTAIANTAAIDLMDEVVVPEGCVLGANGQPAYLSESKAIFLNHDYESLPVGTFRNAALRGGRWVCQFALHGETQLARDVRALFALGDDNPVRGVSIGFVRQDGGSASKDEIQKYGPAMYVTRSWLWMELSVTPQPCNPEAWVVSSGKSVPKIDDRTAGRLDDLAAKGVIHKTTLASMGMIEPKPRKTKRLLIIEQ